MTENGLKPSVCPTANCLTVPHEHHSVASMRSTALMTTLCFSSVALQTLLCVIENESFDRTRQMVDGDLDLVCLVLSLFTQRELARAIDC